MRQIDDPSQATKLAQAIVADIKLYHEDDIAHGRGLSEAIDDGRKLFTARVAPSLHGVFEEAAAQLAALGTASHQEAHDDTRPSDPQPQLPPGLFEDPPPRRKPNTTLPLLLLVMIGAVGVAAWSYLNSG